MRRALRAIAGFPPARVGYLNESVEKIRDATEFLIRGATEFRTRGATEFWKRRRSYKMLFQQAGNATRCRKWERRGPPRGPPPLCGGATPSSKASTDE